MSSLSPTKLGRPTRTDEPASEFITIRLTEDEKKKLDSWSYCYEQSKSELVRSCLNLFSYI